MPEPLRDFAELYKLAKRFGRVLEVRDAARRIHARLHAAPDEYGEEAFHYHNLRLLLRVAFQDPLAVRFCVHEVEPLVIVKTILALPGKGFD
ncbi:MAG TPA: hypothetical protein VE988_00200 [Gemmataceae bacterium]|nr:hypothetical protein [Gemmataceae bacterium]